MDEYMIFAERLSAQMELQELSYRQLAEKMGITVTTLFRYAKGQRVPKATEIVKASRALGVTCDYLIGLSDDPHKTSTESVYHPVSVNADLISRQAVIDALRDYLVEKRCPDDGTLTCRLIENEVINKLPTTQPDIIYCKDCKFYTAYDYTGKLMCKRIGKGMILPKPEDYCSYAERITDGKPD